MSQALDCIIGQLFSDVEASTNPVPVPNVSVAALKLAVEFDKIASDAQHAAVAKLVGTLALHDAARGAFAEESQQKAGFPNYARILQRRCEGLGCELAV